MSQVMNPVWGSVGDLFLYPDAHAEDDMRMSADLVAAAFSDRLGRAGRGFGEWLGSVTPSDREELFTRTFDINPTCSLELGWHLYGEDYKRGSFLVDMRRLMASLGIEETRELPDHVVHALRALERLPAVKAQCFSLGYVQPALVKMTEGLDAAPGPWPDVVTGLLEALEAAYGPTPATPSAPSAEASGPYAEGRASVGEAQGAPGGCHAG